MRRKSFSTFRRRPDRASLQQAIADAGMNVRDAMRRKGTPFEALGLDDPSLDDDALIDAMLAEPILINRPFVRTAGGVALCRPAERVFDLIDVSPPAGLTRTDARPLTPDTPVRADDPALAEALAGAGLPIEDLAQTSARFFSYAEPGGPVIGYAAFEPLGTHALVRSVVVLPQARARGHTRTIVPLLLRRAFDAGARDAWLLTETAEPVFERLGFVPVARQDAPREVRGTSQFSLLCPQSATLMHKKITL